MSRRLSGETAVLLGGFPFINLSVCGYRMFPYKPSPIDDSFRAKQTKKAFAYLQKLTQGIRYFILEAAACQAELLFHWFSHLLVCLQGFISAARALWALLLVSVVQHKYFGLCSGPVF